MKALLFLIFLLMKAEIAGADVYDYDAVVVEVIDGDTVKVKITAWPDPLQDTSVRVDGVDTPEKGFRAKCDKEAKKGEEATAFAKTLAKPGDIVKVRYDTKHADKFGRVLSDVYFKDGSRWSERLIKAGKAREYHGEKKSDWCN